MANEGNLALARRMYESINQSFQSGHYETLMQGIAAEDMVDHNAFPGQGPGLEGVRQFLAGVGSAFSNYHVNIEDLISDGDKVVARLTTSGTHTGAFWGVPPTGRDVRMEGIEMFRVENGKIVERWGIFDTAGLMMQMGVMPPPAG